MVYQKNLSIIFAAAFCIAAGAYWLYQRNRHADLIIYNGTIITMDNKRTIIPEGAIAIRGDTIVAVGSTKQIRKQYRPQKMIDAQQQLILPGFINGHTHAAMTLLRGIGDDAPLCDWLERCIFPLEQRFGDPQFVGWGTKLACLELIQTGVTTTVDMYFHESAAAEAFAEMGMRAIAGLSIVCHNDLEKLPAFAHRWSNHPLITPAAAPHSPYTCDTELLKATYASADKLKIPLMMHIAETKKEVTIIQERYGMRPIEYLAHHGLLTPGLIAIHMVHLTDQEIDLVRQHRVSVVYNPISNMKLASGIAPITNMLAADIPVAIGTDGAASNNRLDMFSEMKNATLLQKVGTGDPKALPASTVVALATCEGARALGIDHLVGSLEVGKRADIIAIKTDGAHQTPLYDPISQIVYAAKSSDITMTIINGRVLLQDRIFTYDPEVLTTIQRSVAYYQRQISSYLRQNPWSVHCGAQGKNRLIDQQHKSCNGAAEHKK